ncbi:hypothetical protein BGW80DRAFT_1253621 [Lactifluus volemus]|nr:hypothetical protein BGW80DRAFT_1253621 [Lactifluus volemus]
MSSYAANTPEAYALGEFWRPTEELAFMNSSRQNIRRARELTLLMAGTRCRGLGDHLLLLSELARHRKVPERGYALDFLQAGVELEIFEQESLARTLELYHSANICVADVEARPEVYPIRKRGRISTAHGRLSSGDAVLAQLAEEAHGATFTSFWPAQLQDNLNWTLP